MEKNRTKIKERILKRISPSQKEHNFRKNVVDNFLSEIQRIAQELNYDTSFFVGGSFGKGTYLTGSSDVDIFARFNPKYEDNKLSIFLKEILDKTEYKFEKLKGSRDYFGTEFNKKNIHFKFEIIPNIKIEDISQKSIMRNSTDASPLHVTFLASKIEENENLQSEIRLAKQFFKSKGLYGAESYIAGFSGHVIDNLIAYYGSLENLLFGAKEWKERQFIDICNHYKNFDEAKKILQNDKLSRLVLIDPILRERNAAKALSDDNYARFILVANEFKEFSKYDFEVTPFDRVKTILNAKKFVKKNNLYCVVYTISFDLKTQSQDIIGSKLLKICMKMKSYFESMDFDVFSRDFFVDMKKKEALFVFMFEQVKIPKLKFIRGPEVYKKDFVNSFLKNKSYFFVKDFRVCVYEKRKVCDLKNIINFSKDDFFKLLNKDVSFINKIKIVKYGF